MCLPAGIILFINVGSVYRRRYKFYYASVALIRKPTHVYNIICTGRVELCATDGRTDVGFAAKKTRVVLHICMYVLYVYVPL